MSDMISTNLGVYQRSSTARWYATLTDLTQAEEAAFALTRTAWDDGDILDIGIGGGRTSGTLSARARSYVGVDYSSAMVAEARARYPDLDLRHGDARDLSQFADGTFDFAFFPDNGIDAVDDAGRSLILREVRRVLRPGGIFLFNAHNLDCGRNGKHWRDMLRVRLAPSPVATARSLARVPIRLRNYLRTSGARVRTDRYAIMPDPGNDFASPHYYAGLSEMRRQIDAAGFELLTVVDEAGMETTQTVERDSATLHYVVRRPST